MPQLKHSRSNGSSPVIFHRARTLKGKEVLMDIFSRARTLLLCNVVLFSALAQARVVDSKDYGFSQTDPYKATIGSAVLNPGKALLEDFDLVVHPDVPVLSADYRLHVRFFPATTQATVGRPLLHIIAGLGGDEMGSLSSYFAAEAQRQGFSVIVYPNSLTRNFSLSASGDGVVGAAAIDAQDYGPVIRAALAELGGRGQFFDRHLLSGYSHGALLAAFIQDIDSRLDSPLFERTLLLNSPVNLLYGIRTLDRFSGLYGFSVFRLLGPGLGAKKAVERYRRIATTEESQGAFFSRIRLSKREEKGLIGRLLMSSLSSTIAASQHVRDLGILRKHDGRFLIPKISFEAYVERFFAALFKAEGRDFNLDGLNQQNSLRVLEDHLRSDARVSIIHNADDFLLEAGDLDWIEDTFKERALLFPRGGHLGNVYYRDNRQAFQNWLSTGSLTRAE